MSRWRQELIFRTLVRPFWVAADYVRDHAEDHGRELTPLECRLVRFFDWLATPADLWIIELDMREHQRWAANMNRMLKEARALLGEAKP